MSKKKEKQTLEGKEKLQTVKRKKGRPRKVCIEQTQSNSSYSSHHQDLISKVIRKALELRHVQTLHELYTQIIHIKHYVWRSWQFGELQILLVRPSACFLGMKVRQIFDLNDRFK